MRSLILLAFCLSAAIVTAAQPSIEIPRGDRITLRFPCQYPDGTPVDVTGWDLEASIRSSLTGAALTNYTETAGAGGTNGVLSWSWDVSLAPGRYLLGFRWTTADGITFTPLPRAPFTVLPSLLAPTNGEAVAGAPPSRGAAPREWVFTSQISPTAGTLQSLAVNVGLRGPQGPQGPQGDPASTNGLVGADSLGLLAWSNDLPWALVTGEPTFLVPSDTNGFVGYASLGTLAWSNDLPWAMVTGEPTFLVPSDTNGFVKASITNGLGGGGTNVDPNTNWWAVVRIDLGNVGGNEFVNTRWSDAEIWISTNGFGNMDGNWGFNASDIVFKFTTTNSQFNGVPDYELFSTNTWMPAVWGLASHPSDANYHRITAFYQQLPYSLAEWGTNTFGGNLITPRALTVAIRDAGAWFHPSNRLSAIVKRLSWDGVGEQITNWVWNGDLEQWNAYPMDDWREIPIEWTYHDPRPRRVTIFTDGSWQYYEIETEHQQP